MSGLTFNFEVGDYITSPGMAHVRKAVAIHGEKVAYINETVGGMHIGYDVDGWVKVEETWEAGKWYEELEKNAAPHYLCTLVFPDGNCVLTWPKAGSNTKMDNWAGTTMGRGSRKLFREIEVPEWAQ